MNTQPVRKALVTGAGGFIGHHLVTSLKERGYWVRGVDLKRPEYKSTDADEFLVADLRSSEACLEATAGMDDVYALAADMGGMGFIANNHSVILHNNALINLHTIEAARVNGAKRLLYTSSACVYPEYKQTEANVAPLKEDDAYPAMPQDAYGWEKLITERLCLHYRQDYGLDTRIVRFHNIFGPHGTWDGGREKAPAATCRKVIDAIETGKDTIEIWGDGKQTRSFMYIDDCIEGILKIMHSKIEEPINLGSDELTTIEGLYDMVEDIAGVELKHTHNLSAPKGVNGRNSDNTLIKKYLGWAPGIRLRDGMERTYRWIHEEYLKVHRGETVRT